jgi:hypothetical protein
MASPARIKALVLSGNQLLGKRGQIGIVVQQGIRV